MTDEVTEEPIEPPEPEVPPEEPAVPEIGKRYRVAKVTYKDGRVTFQVHGWSLNDNKWLVTSTMYDVDSAKDQANKRNEADLANYARDTIVSVEII